MLVSDLGIITGRWGGVQKQNLTANVSEKIQMNNESGAVER